MILHFNQAVPGEDHADAWQMVWNLWWVRFALEHGQSPFQTDMIFYPQGTGLYLHALNALNGLISLPVQYIGAALGGAAVGAIAGYNFIVLFCLTVGAYGGFCLARYLWGDGKAALIAGLAYGFSTYNFDHLLGHLNLVSSEFIPFYILFFLKTLGGRKSKIENRKSKIGEQGAGVGDTSGSLTAAVLTDAERGKRSLWIRDGLIAAGFLGLMTLLELQYVLYMAMFSALYLGYLTVLWGWQRGRKQAIGFSLAAIYGRAAVIAGVFLLITLPFSLPTINEALNNPNTVPPRQDNIYSADLLAYFYPSPFHPFWGEAMQRAIKPFTATLIEKVVFPGFVVYLLALVGLVLAGRQKAEGGNFRFSIFDFRLKTSVLSPQSSVLFWLLVVIVFAVLSFGRRLHINGIEVGPTLPAALIYKLPILNITRVPGRFAVVALLGLALLAAWGLSKLGKHWAGQNRRYNLAVSIAFLALAFELLPIPYRLTYYNVPDFYRQLATDPRRDYAILDVPLNYGRYQYETAYLQYQMTHHKPLLNGYISRNPVFPPYYGVPVFVNFRDLSAEVKSDILPPQPLEVGVLRYFGVGYISINKDILNDGERSRTFEIIAKLLPGQPPVSDSPTLTVYQVPPGPKTSLFYNLVLPDWHEGEKEPDGKLSRWVKGDLARLDFWTSEPRRLELEFPLRSFQEQRPVEFWLNDRRVGQVQAGVIPQTVRLTLELQPGQNRLSFKIGGKAYRPVDVGLGSDSRTLTISVGEIKLSGL